MLIENGLYYSYVDNEDYISHFNNLIEFIKKEGYLENIVFPYGYTDLRLVEKDKKIFIEEWNENKEIWLDNISRSLAFWHRQHLFVNKWNSSFVSCHWSKLVAHSEGIFDDSLLLDMSRGDMDEKNSGWILTTEKYNNDIHSLKFSHVCHIIDKIPDIIDLLAIEPGYYILIHPKGSVVEVGKYNKNI